jgi:GNAT superfamily N-acetyltransferase
VQANELAIRRATADDRGDVIALVSEMFQQDISARYAWLYEGNPHGAALTWLAYDGDVPVGVTSVFPRKVSVDGAERMGSIGGDCYVAPRARRRGLATQLHAATFAEMGAGGVEFMYGPPLPNNLKALAKAGSAEVGAFVRFTRLLSGAALQQQSKQLARVASGALRAVSRVLRVSTGGLRLEALRDGDLELDRLARRTAPAGVCPVRDRAFLGWRYPNRATELLAVRRGSDLAGLVALEARDGHAVVVDLFAIDPTQLPAALQLAIDRAAEAGCARIDLPITAGVLSRRRLARMGFTAREERGFQVARARGAALPACLLRPEAWHFTSGDKDMDTVFSAAPV